jgi:hypothetical protein
MTSNPNPLLISYSVFNSARNRLEEVMQYDCVWHHPNLKSCDEEEKVSRIVNLLLKDFEILFALRDYIPFPLRQRITKDPGERRVISLQHAAHLIYYTDRDLYKKISSYCNDNHIPEYVDHEELVIKINDKHSLSVDLTILKTNYDCVEVLPDLVKHSKLSSGKIVELLDFIQGSPLPRISADDLKEYIFFLISLKPKNLAIHFPTRLCMKLAATLFKKKDWENFIQYWHTKV